MNIAYRKPLIAGNWKMHTNVSEAKSLAEDIVAEVGQQTEVSVLICPPFTALSEVARCIENTQVRLGAQNMYPTASGAFTGEVSPAMLRQLFVSYVILGHSERRSIFREKNSFINQKLLTALENNLRPILCVGESLEERERGETLVIIKTQLNEGLLDLSPEHGEQIVIAYEPVWAIGTGKTATPAMAQEVHAFIRGELAHLFGQKVADRVRILYGGSMKPENAGDLLVQSDIDGGLVGGASLDPRMFTKIVEVAGALSKEMA